MGQTNAAPKSAQGLTRLSAADKLEIKALMARYCHHADYQDWEGEGSIYTDDVYSHLIGATVRNAGREENIVHSQKSALITNGKNRRLHFNFYIDATDEGAQVSYYVVNVNAGDTPLAPQMVITGRKVDQVIREGGVWKIKRRVLTPDQNVITNY